MDFTDTFSTALDNLSAKIVLARSRKFGVPARHGDVPNAYVRAEEEAELEILLNVPQGMNVDTETLASLGVVDKRQVALRLRKSLYGLKQAGCLWAQHLRKTLLKLGFEQSYTDSCVYKRGSGSDPTVVGVYVDDLLVTGMNASSVDNFFKDMSVLEVKDLGVRVQVSGYWRRV